MRARWFGDDRDIVKWTALLHLAREHSLSYIIQVGYFRADERPSVTVGDGQISIEDAVWSFFRDPSSISALGAATGIPIAVISAEFDPHHRDAYVEMVHERLRASRPGSVLLFLDPDTGLEPARAAAEHVSRSELRAYWQALKTGDWIALYQHARREKQWCERVCAELGELCGGADVHVAKSSEVGRDVALLFIEKR